MARPVALLDACVLYPAPIRDLLMQLAQQGAYQPRWSEDLHDEWMRSVLAGRPDLSRSRLDRTRRLMEIHAPDARVVGYRDLIETLTLPDPDDRHALAAAIVGGASCIVTYNLSDFPVAALAAHGVVAAHPDAFLCGLLAADKTMFVAAVHQVLDRLCNPPATVDQYLSTLSGLALPNTVAGLGDLL